MVDNNSFETVSGETSAEFDHHEEDNILELVFAEEIYSSNFHYDLNFYLYDHPLCELNIELYDVFQKFVNEEIETFMGIAFYYSYGLAVLTFLDKNPNTCIEQFKKISESERIVCSSFAILYGLLLKRKGNSKIVESFIKSLRRELTEMENRIGWTGLSNGIKDEIGSQEKKIMNFHPVGLEWTLDEIESFDKEYFLNQYPIKSVSIKFIEHILRTADTIKEQKKAYKLIVKSLESIYNDGHCEKSVFYHLKNNLKVLSRPYTVGEDSVQKYEIRLPNMWWYEIDREDFGNYLSLSATNNTLEREQTKEEINNTVKRVKITHEKSEITPNASFVQTKNMGIFNETIDNYKIDFVKLKNFITNNFIPFLKYQYEWYALHRFLYEHKFLSNKDVSKFSELMNQNDWFPNVNKKCNADSINDYAYLNSYEPNEWIEESVMPKNSKATIDGCKKISKQYLNLSDTYNITLVCSND